MKTKTLVLMPMFFMAIFWGLLKVALPVLPHLPHILHTSETIIHTIASLAFVCSGLSSLIWGLIIDKVNFKQFTIIISIVNIIVLSLPAFATSVWFFGLFFVMGCVLCAFFLVCSRSFPILYLKNDKQKRQAFSLITCGGYGAAILAPLLGGWVYDFLCWRYVFFIIPLWLVAILGLSSVLEKSSKITVKTTVSQDIVQIYFHLKNKKLLYNTIAVFIIGMIVPSYYVSLPFWLVAKYHTDASLIAYYLLPMLFPGFILPLFASYVYSLVKEKTIIKASIATFFLAAILTFILPFLAVVPSWCWVIPGVLMTIAVAYMVPLLSFDAFRDIKKQKNLAAGLFSVAIYFAGGIGIYITDFISFTTFYLESIFIILATLVMIYFIDI